MQFKNQKRALSNNIVSRLIDEMSKDIEKQLVEKLKTKNISKYTDESTFRNSEGTLLTSVTFIDKILFCKIKEISTTFRDNV